MSIRTTIRLVTVAVFAAAAMPALALDLTVTHFGTGMYGVPFAVAKEKGYFKEGGLDVTGFIEPRAGVAPTPAHLAQLIAAGRKASVRAIVHEPHEPEDASRFVAQKLGVPVIRLATSVRSLAGTDDYLALLDYNVATLARALATRSP